MGKCVYLILKEKLRYRKKISFYKKINQMIDLFSFNIPPLLDAYRGGAHEWKNRLEVINVSDYKDVNTKSLKLKS